jgi:hypothetical protein
MPRYFIRPSHNRVFVRKVDRVLWPSFDNRPPNGTETEIYVDDLDLFFGAISSQRDENWYVLYFSKRHNTYISG